MKKKLTIYLLGIGILLVLPLGIESTYLRHVLVASGIYAILALGLNFVMGFSGQTPFGYPVFFGIGAYSTALSYLYLGTSFWVGLLLAPIIAGIAGFLIGYPSFRLRGHYFAISTLAFALIVEIILKNWISFTRGPMGISGIPHPRIGFLNLEIHNELSWYYLVLILLAVCLGVIYRLMTSKAGEAWLAIRENEELAQSLGINVFWHKMTSFIIGGMIGGVAGCAYAHYFSIVSPELVGFHYIITIFAMVIIGGKGSLAGPILGAVLFTFLPEYLRAAKAYRMTLYGLCMLLGIIFMPEGINGIIKAGYAHLRARRQHDPAA